MEFEDLMMDAGRLWEGESSWTGPLAFIDLDQADGSDRSVTLPPCPVVGVGDRLHPLAERLDAVVEPPVSARALARQVLAFPNAAAATVHLLRILPGLSMEAGLAAESMAYAMLQGSAEHRTWLSEQKNVAPDDGPGRVLTQREGERLIVTLDRALAGNAIDQQMRDGLYEALLLAALDPDVERVLLRGQGKAFSLGAELSEFGTTLDPATAHMIRHRTLPARQAVRCADKLEVHIQGACVGAGLELAAYASRVTASSKAWFQLPELAMGILPGAGGCVSLTRRIGRQRTALMVLSGRRLGVGTALDWGLVDAIVDEPA